MTVLATSLAPHCTPSTVSSLAPCRLVLLLMSPLISRLGRELDQAFLEAVFQQIFFAQCRDCAKSIPFTRVFAEDSNLGKRRSSL
jgi:hypothetical protein